MKKLFMAVLIALAAMFCQSAQAAEEWVPNMDAPVVGDVPTDVTNLGGSAIDIKPVEGGNRFEITFYGVKVTPRGGPALYDAEIVRIASGILDAAKASGNKKVASEYVADVVPSANGVVNFTTLNYAMATSVPVVEHLWGIGKTKGDNQVKYLVLNPDSPWVCYETLGNGKPNLETLAIGILMCPDGQAVPLKSLGKGKIKQGKHPELADACK
ncbi:MAG: hypothetical protein HYV53_02875 [Parcubacteria group bacterium]|nr:hypothetical protein [Parcubacteria group bacterium]